MLALASLLRQVYRLAEHQVPETAPATDTPLPESPASLDGHAGRARELFRQTWLRARSLGYAVSARS
jgi:hypothetical protein